MKHLLIIHFITYSCYAQVLDSANIKHKIKFLNYLNKNNQSDDAIYLVRHFNSLNTNDSLRLYEIKLLVSNYKYQRADSLLEVVFSESKDSINEDCSYILIKNHCSIMLGSYEKITEPKCKMTPTQLEVWKIQLISKLMLQKKYDEFKIAISSRKCIDPILSKIELKLNIQVENNIKQKRKNPFVSGLLSALIPGLGKVYSGKPHEALFSFLPVMFNYAQAAEGYYYKQFKSPHLYVFASIGTVFYFSNIIGSVKAAKRKNLEKNFRSNANFNYEFSKITSYY